MHDHGEKIHICKPCGYWHVANGRFQTWECPQCSKAIDTYSSRQWIIDNIDKNFEAIPKDKVRVFNAEGFIKKI